MLPAIKVRRPLAQYPVLCSPRKVSRTILACVYLAISSIGLVFHVQPVFTARAFHRDDLLIEVTETAAILNGAFIRRGDNWARWLPFSWMALHVVISFFDSLQKVATHALFFVVIGYLLFRPEARDLWTAASQRQSLLQIDDEKLCKRAKTKYCKNRTFFLMQRRRPDSL